MKNAAAIFCVVIAAACLSGCKFSQAVWRMKKEFAPENPLGK